MNLQTRARLAVPLYWLAGKFLTWANWVDGPQPRLPRGATKAELLAAFKDVKLRKH